jgi:methionyl aminopeptidase
MIPSFKGLYDFPASACISINEEVVDGIPDKKRILKDGDIVSVDVGSTYKGYCSDAARTYAVGEISETAQKLIDAARDSFFAGMEFCKVGFRLSDVSHAIQQKAEGEGFSVIRDFVGHGIGQDMHEDPQIPNYGKPGRGPRLVKGMVFAIEPMICEGGYEVETLSNRWTVVTADGKLSAHYENTVVITDGEPELLTLAY